MIPTTRQQQAEQLVVITIIIGVGALTVLPLLHPSPILWFVGGQSEPRINIFNVRVLEGLTSRLTTYLTPNTCLSTPKLRYPIPEIRRSLLLPVPPYEKPCYYKACQSMLIHTHYQLVTHTHYQLATWALKNSTGQTTQGEQQKPSHRAPNPTSCLSSKQDVSNTKTR